MRVVIKVGTSSLVSADGSCVRLSVLATVCETAMRLRAAGHKTIIVTSGAVGMGCMRMGCPRPTDLGDLQAMAAVGGMALSRLYEQAFELTGGRCAQVLLTYSTFGSKEQFRTAKVSRDSVQLLLRGRSCHRRATAFTSLAALPDRHRPRQRAFDSLLRHGVTPIVNENDVVSCEELQVSWTGAQAHRDFTRRRSGMQLARPPASRLPHSRHALHRLGVVNGSPRGPCVAPLVLPTPPSPCQR